MLTDGHELAVASNFLGCWLLIDRTLPKGWARHMTHRHPMAAMAVAWGIAGIAMPLVIPKIRQVLKLPTDQYDDEHEGVVRNKWRKELEL
mmetsp:Transcript_20845/g.26929  ORF Transcript_20845/g.26929 Transcript_20845/m.26929 type:complete len:90 (+) Transcript_20845:215-484(+)|eukprot:CAMPEP_0198137754 /NCGR_PEP_ID=MMETSP1443-20131203/1213_1 /TAXON_ID=186043 /ORGANISM="Entomoneis sp., Strain CCMP2396" /LENGTH=89 /DNA_ID=CAMNT_0043799285 /DNA_START=126 /DNA_END=395 /DNA_ORIENTATION=+